ncbi:MAG TPA: ATP-binding protein [Anaerolineales bacterium]|nr:ATP-binding protein [Anaerolineales bacterium]HNC07389.1 ATP-binding protein [Anaerolineales bacterium]
MKFIKAILRPPVFNDEEKTHQAFLLNVLLWALIVIPIPYLIYVLISLPELAQRAMIQAGIGEAINIFLLVLMRRGFVRQAAVLQVSSIWFFFTLTAFTAFGVQDEAYLFGYPLVILIAGLLLGARMSLVTTFFSLASGLAMVITNNAGLLVTPRERPAMFTWVISLVIFPVMTILQYLTSRTMRAALQKARKSEERYRLISRVSSDYTFESKVNARGEAEAFWMAGAFEKMTGYTEEEYIAKGGWYAHIHPDDLEKDAEDMKKLLNNQDVVNSEIRTFTKNGEIRWERIFAHPIWSEEKNRLVGILGAVQDITEQKRSEEREAQRKIMLEKVVQLGKQVTENNDLDTILQRIWHAIHDDLGFDRLGIFLYNTELNSMDSALGTDAKGQKEDTRGHRFPIAEWTTFKSVLEKPDGLYYTRNYDVENNIPKDNEMYGVKEYAAVAVWAGEKPVAAITVDMLITQRQIQPEQLEALRLFAGYAGLAIENAKLYSALQEELKKRQQLINELEDKNTELERFTYTVSHDLKSPLVTINGFLGYAEKDAREGKFSHFEKDIERIRQAVKKMQALLNDLLELSRVGRLMNDPTETRFGEIVRETLALLEVPIKEARVSVEFIDEGYIIFSDRVRLVEVVQNLIDNSIKFMGSQPHPRIQIGTMSDVQGQPIFFIKDNGIGIDPKYIERIFGLFNKLDVHSQGSGIGLTIVKRIIEVHGGNIWVESQLGRGSTFFFTLPNSAKGT